MGKEVSNNAFSRYGDASLVIWPNLGKPAMLSISKYSLKLKSDFLAEIIIVCNEGTTTESLTEQINGRIHLYPLLGIDINSRQAHRGKILPSVVEKITPIEYREVGNQHDIRAYLELEEEKRSAGLYVESPRTVLQYIKPFLERPVCFKVLIKIPLSPEVKQYLEPRSFVLFDLVQTFPQSNDLVRINYHAIALCHRKTWMDMSFIQITDLHISERNDNFLGVITKNLRSSISKSMVNFYDNAVKPLFNKVQSIFSPKNNPQDGLNSKENSPVTEISKSLEEENIDDHGDDPKFKTIALEKRIINPNNYLRRFIRHANELADKGELDFLVMTGDLIDFCIRAESLLTAYDYNYENTNWVRFLDILLNRPIKPPAGTPLLGIEPGEELLVPIFTMPGNHDYRVGHYSIQSLGIYKHLGMKWHEAINYMERTPFAPLETSVKAMLPYFQYINPFLDSFLKLGNQLFIFLDSGFDALLEFKSLLMAEPALTGFSEGQLDLIRQLISDLSPKGSDGNTFFFSHAPFINPVIKKSLAHSLASFVGLSHKQELTEFKESRLFKQGKSITRSDIDLEYRAGTISNFWSETIGFVQQAKGIALNGHTHKWREFRTERADFPTISHTGYGKKVLNPFAIYWDDYSEMYGNSDLSFIHSKLPFHFQTPALGIADHNYGVDAGAYRVIQIQKNRIVKIKMEFIDAIEKERKDDVKN